MPELNELLKSNAPIKCVSFISILADAIKASETEETEVSFLALPPSYKLSIANLCDKLYRYKAIRVNYRQEGNKVIFRKI